MRMMLAILISLILSDFSVKAENPDFPFLDNDNIIYGVGVSRNFKKANDKALADLATFLDVRVVSTMRTDNNGDVVEFTSKTTTKTSVKIFNARRECVKKGSKWYVYRYIIIDNPYNHYTAIEDNDKSVETPKRTMQRVTFAKGTTFK